MCHEQSCQDLAPVDHNLGVVFSEKIQKPLLTVSHDQCLPFAHLTLLVTVRANFLMLLRLPFSQRICEYIDSTLVPSCFLVRNLRPGAGLLDGLASPVPRLTRPGVLDLEIADKGRGVRDPEAEGEWKA